MARCEGLAAREISRKQILSKMKILSVRDSTLSDPLHGPGAPSVPAKKLETF